MIPREFLDADAFERDRYGWVTNQAAHAFLVGVPLAGLFGWLGLPWWAVGAAVFLAYTLVWEFLVQRGGDWRDSLYDGVMVAAGASCVAALAYGASLAWVCYGITLVGLWFGWWRRSG